MDAKTPTVTITGFSHVNFMTLDVERCTAFYTDVLGLRLLERAPELGGTGSIIECGTAQIHLLQVKEMTRPTGLVPHVALLVPTEEYRDTCAALEARGVEWLVKPNSRIDFGSIVVWQAFVTDPDGNVIEITNA